MQGSRPDTWDTSGTVTIFGSEGYRLCALRRVLRGSRASARSRSPDPLAGLSPGQAAWSRRASQTSWRCSSDSTTSTRLNSHVGHHMCGLWTTVANIVIITPFKHVLANSTTLVLPIGGEYHPTALARPHADAPDEHSLLHGIDFINTAGRRNGGRPPSRDWVPN